MNWTRRRLPNKRLASLNVPTRFECSKIKRALYEAFITPDKRLDSNVVSDVSSIIQSPIRSMKTMEPEYGLELPIIDNENYALPSSGTSCTRAPTIFELSQRIDEIEERVQSLNECCENILKLVKKIL